MSGQQPTLRQVIPALLGGAMVVACTIPLLLLTIAIFTGGGLALLLAFVAFIVAAPIAFAHALALGLPLYLVLRRYFWLTRIGAAIAGCVIGAVPIGLGLYAVPAMVTNPDAQMPAAFGFGLLGAVGGLAFHHILRKLTDDGAEQKA